MKTFKQFYFSFLVLSLSVISVKGETAQAYSDGKIIKIISIPSENTYFKPLETIKLSLEPLPDCILIVRDGKGSEYFRTASSGAITFLAGGAAGTQSISLLDKKGILLDQAFFTLNSKTEILDEKGEFTDLLKLLYNSMQGDQSYGRYLYKNKQYYTFDGWFQDNVHTFKGLKYFESNVKDFVDLFAEGQREDGMIFDNYYLPYDQAFSWLDRFGEPWLSIPEDANQNSSFFVRIPVENEPEYSFLEAVYYVWKATGDDGWMKKRLENCLKAINYTRTDPYRWSDKFKLTKRAYTIDVWDFQCRDDASQYRLGDIMKAEFGKTRYGISYADNIGMAVGCEYVSEMLAYSDRVDEARKMKTIADEWRKQTDEICWNGNFYRQWVAEDPTFKRDFGGTDESKQVSLSNSYVLNRRISHEKAVSIIKTYQKIKEEMPKSSPGEWYLLYPPYEKGWHVPKWEYMNGGVSPITAGELSHGAFENGYETYGVDILRRIALLAKRSGNRLYNTYKGALAEKPIINFNPISLKDYANADFKGDEPVAGVCSWTGESITNNDMINFPLGKQVFHDIPFDIIDPAQNNHKGCLILSADKGYLQINSIPINSKIGSIYLVHAKSGGSMAGYLKVNYADGTSERQNIIDGQQLAGWWYPREGGNYKIAWQGPNRFCISVGMYLWGFNNPHPDKLVKNLQLVNENENTKWMIAGITTSDKPVYFDPGIVSYGIPDNWADAAVVYALVEGLVGSKDAGVAYNKAILAPRWQAAGINEAKATIKYEASGGYLSYQYNYDEKNLQMKLLYTGNSLDTKVRLLIPQSKSVVTISMDGNPVSFQNELVESTKYAVFEVNKPGVHTIICKLN